jgi:hypothetical protein
MMNRILMATVVFGAAAANARAHTLENESLRLDVDDKGQVTIHDKRNGATWLQVIPKSEGPSWSWGVAGRPLPIKEFGPDKVPEVTSVEASPNEITVSLKWKIPLVCRWSLSGPDNVRAMLESREEEAPVPGDGRWMALYPPPFYSSGTADYAVVCEDEGVLYRTADTDPESDQVRYGSGSMGRSRSMPWSGLLDQDFSAGMMTLVDTPFYAIEKMIFCDTRDGRRSLPAVQWEKGRDETFNARSLRFHMFTEGGYVGMAKRFRSELVAAGNFRTLLEKAQDVPAVEKLKGAADMWIFPDDRIAITEADVERIHSLGFEKLLLQVIGRKAFTPGAVKKAREFDYLIGKYHNYSWVYERQLDRDPSLKRVCIRGPNGYEPSGSLWGKNLKYCPAMLSEKLRTVAAEERVYGYNVLFTDCTTAGGSVKDCFDENHPLARETAAIALSESLKVVSDQGQVVGSERGFWWAAADCHFFEGIETLIRYFNIFTRESSSQHHSGPFHIERPADYERYMLAFNYGPQNRVPLFQLVFHDAVVCTRRWNDHYGRDLNLWRLSDLMSIAYGTPPILKFRGDDTPHVLKEAFASVRDAYMRTCRDVCGWHERIGFDEMADHRFLTKNRLVQETRFSSGHAVVVNFGSEVWDDDRGFQVPAKEFHKFVMD